MYILKRCVDQFLLFDAFLTGVRQYLLRLLLAILEHWATIKKVASEEILDGREWDRLKKTVTSIRDLVSIRILDLMSELLCYCPL